MKSFASQDLQRNTGDLQTAAAVSPIVVTAHGKPRNVMMSVDEFARLKRRAGEDIPIELRPREAVVLRPLPDALGYDTTDLAAAAEQMASDEFEGRGEEAVQTELSVLRKRFNGSAA